jgi:lysylphosphatidylglycerol synthetase-like protein (DUF2156 family)
MSANRSTKEGVGIALITVAITQIALNSIGINKTSVVIVVTLLMVFGIVFAVTMIKYGNKGLGRRLNITASIIMLLACILAGAMLIMIISYPQFGYTHELLAITLAFSLLEAL